MKGPAGDSKTLAGQDHFLGPLLESCYRKMPVVSENRKCVNRFTIDVSEPRPECHSKVI